MHTVGRAGRLALLIAVDVAVLVACRPHPLRTVRHLRNFNEWVALGGADRAGVELARLGLWLVALWLLIGLLAAVAVATPGRLGHLGVLVSGRFLPVALRTFVAGSIGLGVTLAPAVAGASAAVHTPAGATSTTATTTRATSTTATTTRATSTSAASPVAARAVPARPVAARPAGASGPRADVPWPQSGDDVIVAPGDCLWVIAAHRLGGAPDNAAIDAEWHRWYRANSHIVGTDPGVIHPGQHLQAPPPRGRSS